MEEIRRSDIQCLKVMISFDDFTFQNTKYKIIRIMLLLTAVLMFNDLAVANKFVVSEMLF